LSTWTETITLAPPVIGLAAGLAVDVGIAVAAALALGVGDIEAMGEDVSVGIMVDVAAGLAVADGVVVNMDEGDAVDAGLAVADGITDSTGIMVAVIEVICGSVLEAAGTIIIAEATASVDNGVLSLLTSSAENMCKPGATSGQV
jgi:hypothetical protein